MNEHRERLEPLDQIIKIYGELGPEESMELAKMVYIGLPEHMQSEFLNWAEAQD